MEKKKSFNEMNLIERIEDFLLDQGFVATTLGDTEDDRVKVKYFDKVTGDERIQLRALVVYCQSEVLKGKILEVIVSKILDWGHVIKTGRDVWFNDYSEGLDYAKLIGIQND